MERQRYRAAVIGCGKMSRGHAHALANNERVELVTGADISEAARAAFAEEFGLERMFSNPVEMLEAEQLDIVSISTWPPLHAEQTEAAFAAGVKGVWCEKPMAVHLSEADRMLQAADRSGGTLIINHQRRYVQSYNEALDLVTQGAIGDLIQITGICGGDALTDGTHLIDMTRYLNHDTPVESVFGAIDMSPMGDVNPDGMGTIEFNQTRKRYGHHIESGSMAILTFENGVRGHLEIGTVAREGYQRFILDGTEGRIELSGDRAFPDGSRVRVLRKNGETESLPTSSFEGAMDQALQDMIETMETGAPHRLDGWSGRKDLEIVNAIYESARRRMVIRLPLSVSESPLEAMLIGGEIDLN